MPQSKLLIIKDPAFDWDQSPGSDCHFHIHCQISRSPSQRDFTCIRGIEGQKEKNYVKKRDRGRLYKKLVCLSNNNLTSKQLLLSTCTWMLYSMQNTSISDSTTLQTDHQAEWVEFRLPNTSSGSLPHLEAILS